MAKKQKVPKASKAQLQAAATPTEAKLADTLAWVASMNATKDAKGKSVAQGLKAAKEMLVK